MISVLQEPYPAAGRTPGSGTIAGRVAWASGEARVDYHRGLQSSMPVLGHADDPPASLPVRGSHSDCYADGQPGEMRVLKLSAKLAAGSFTASERNTLRRYCLQDVKPMFAIARRCERGLFSPQQRGGTGEQTRIGVGFFGASVSILSVRRR